MSFSDPRIRRRLLAARKDVPQIDVPIMHRSLSSDDELLHLVKELPEFLQMEQLEAQLKLIPHSITKRGVNGQSVCYLVDILITIGQPVMFRWSKQIHDCSRQSPTLTWHRFCSEDRVTMEALRAVADRFTIPTPDGRCSLDGTLHRIMLSSTTARQSDEAATGDLRAIADSIAIRVHRTRYMSFPRNLGLQHPNHGQGVVVFGEPGSGKTTILREIATPQPHFQEYQRDDLLIVVDTHGEIGPLPEGMDGCVRLRLRPTTPSAQADTIAHAVRFYNPNHLVVDDLINASDVTAVIRAIAAGVRVTAGCTATSEDCIAAHPELSGLAGIQMASIGQDVQVIAAAATVTAGATRHDPPGLPAYWPRSIQEAERTTCRMRGPDPVVYGGGGKRWKHQSDQWVDSRSTQKGIIVLVSVLLCLHP